MSVKKTKINYGLILVLVVGLVFWGMVFGAISQTFDTSAPAGGDSPKSGDNEIRAHKDAIQERMNDHNGQADEGDHLWVQTGTTVDDDHVGQHRKVTFSQVASDPDAMTTYGNGTIADVGHLYQKDVSGNGELFWEDEADNVVQMTSGGVLLTDVANDVYVKSVDNGNPASFENPAPKI